jgi:hypothetical protein
VQHLVLTRVLGCAAAHERQHVSPCVEPLQERLFPLQVHQQFEVLLVLQFALELRTIAIARYARHDAWPFGPGVWRLLLADQGVERLDGLWIS